jgi:hypothetical protein
MRSDSEEVILVLIDRLEFLIGNFEFTIFLREGLCLYLDFVLERMIEIQNLKCKSDLRKYTVDDFKFFLGNIFFRLFCSYYKKKKVSRSCFFKRKYSLSYPPHFFYESRTFSFYSICFKLRKYERSAIFLKVYDTFWIGKNARFIHYINLFYLKSLKEKAFYIRKK